MLAISDEELQELLGETIECHICKQLHSVEYGEVIRKDGSKRPSKEVAFYRCGDSMFLAGVNGRSIRKKSTIVH